MSIKAAFLAHPGEIIIEADYSQMEVACLAAASRDPVLISEVEQGVDMHLRNAARWLHCLEQDVSKKHRKMAKIKTFQLAYGARAPRIAADFGLPVAETQAFIDRFCEKYQGVDAWWAVTTKVVNENLQPHAVFLEPDPQWRYDMVLPYGKRYCFLAQYQHDHWKGDNRPKVGPQFTKNYPIQGLAADILKVAQASLWRHRGDLLAYGAIPSLQIHDSLCFRAPDTIDMAGFTAMLEHHMVDVPLQRINELAGCDWWPENLPLRIEMKTGRRWSEMVDFN